MLRWSGVLAVVACAALVGGLAIRTQSAEVRGTVRKNSASPLFPERSPLVVLVIFPGTTSPEELDRLVLTGLNLSGTEEKKDEEVVAWNWEVEIPDDVARTAKLGDEVVISARRFDFPGVEGDYVRHLRYHGRRGSETWSVGDASNWKFLLAYGIAGCGPILLWAAGCGVAALCSLARKGA